MDHTLSNLQSLRLRHVHDTLLAAPGTENHAHHVMKVNSGPADRPVRRPGQKGSVAYHTRFHVFGAINT